MRRKQASRMSEIPQLRLPGILVDDDNDYETRDETRRLNSISRPPQVCDEVTLSEEPARSDDMTSRDVARHHPLNQPRASSSLVQTSNSPATFSFELCETEGQEAPGGEMTSHRSSVHMPPTQNMLDDSLWMENIRRSTTLHKSGNSSSRYEDLN